MLTFNSRGFLVPNRNIRTTLDLFKKYFVDEFFSEHREKLFENYIYYSNELKSLSNNANLIQWINGSFVTKILNPRDIDLVTFIDHDIIDGNEPIFSNFKYPQSIEKFGVDAYIVKVYPNVHKNYPLYICDRMYWMDQFDTSKRNRAGNKYPKGFIEIMF